MSIAELTSRVNELTQSVNVWGTALFWATFAVVVSGVMVFVFQVMKDRRSEELEKVKTALAEAKEAQLQSSLRPDRDFTNDQRAALVDTLKAAPHCAVILMASVTEPEAVRFAEKLRLILEEAGWVTGGMTGYLNAATYDKGITIVQKESGEAIDCAAALILALETLGVKKVALRSGSDETAAKQLLIQVGPMP